MSNVIGLDVLFFNLYFWQMCFIETSVHSSVFLLAFQNVGNAEYQRQNSLSSFTLIGEGDCGSGFCPQLWKSSLSSQSFIVTHPYTFVIQSDLFYPMFPIITYRNFQTPNSVVHFIVLVIDIITQNKSLCFQTAWKGDSQYQYDSHWWLIQFLI